MLPMDCHTHTEISPDSEAKLAQMCARAAALGLRAYAVTDHVELCRYFPQGYYGVQPRNEEDFFDYAQRFERAMQQNEAARGLCGDMCFVSGIEMGEPDADFGLAESLYRDKRLDFTIASLHELRGKLDFYFLDYTQEDAYALLDAYFASLEEISRHDCYDVLGHLTYPLRYIEGEAGIRVDLGRYEERIAQILRNAITRGRGIELNTSGYRQRYGKPLPGERLLRLYRDLGGTILTLGSDAHRPEDVGAGIAQGAALAASCGFDRVCYFLRHEPHWIEL
ncbi:MAG: histidinol-phosphatase HisJ family protein [Oscillospiraceae bacterium]|nr:histidinol-phosphatase HisJ family protein [Oscillospiraceae bacterium]